MTRGSSCRRSLTRFWRLLDQVDVAWVLGPHPLGIAFALIAHARERRVVLGVRQDTLAYIRHRHPGRLGLRLTAWALELTWRGLTRLDATVVVGEDLARRYRGSRTLVPIAVSLIDDADLADAGTVLARPYDGDLRVLSVGRLDPEKNPLLLADVLARLRAFDPRWRLVVCGDGSERQALEARLRSHGLAAHAELRGAVPFHELRDAYATSHAVLHVSWTEGVPQVLFEAFAAGVPVVATDVGGVAAAVGDAALLVPPGAPEAAAHGLARIAGDAALRAELVVRGLERARERTLRSQLERVVAVLERDAWREPSVSHARLAEVA
jgi:glycosyltransferase involved in cell wall biosynthesis